MVTSVKVINTELIVPFRSVSKPVPIIGDQVPTWPLPAP